MTTPSNAELREAITDIIDRHTVEWKAGHNHLIVEQVIALFQAREQEILTELLGELPEKWLEGEASKGYQGSTAYFQALGHDKAIDQVVSVIERLINAGKLDNPNSPTQELDKSQNKTNDGGRNGGL